MKRRIFLSVVSTVFLRLQMYEAIAAIFWQSARKTMYFLGEVDLMFGFDWYLSGPTDRWGISTCSRIYHLKLSYLKFKSIERINT